jgi:hypothetical protein
MDQEIESNEGQEGTEGLCVECGVPPYISSQHTWLNNGDIVYANLNTHRITLMEFEFFDLMIKGIEESIGYSIEHIVLATVQTTMRLYIESLLPREIGEMVKGGTLNLKTVDDGLCEVGRTAGIGVYEYLDMRFEQDENDFYLVKLANPISRFIGMATHGAAMEAVLGYDHKVTCEGKGPGVLELRAFPSPQPEYLRSRLAPRIYTHEDGGFELERCSLCGAPRKLMDFQWITEKGMIVNRATGRHMAASGPNEIEPVFEEMEKELGEDLPRLVVRVLRQYARGGFLPDEVLRSEEAMRLELAVRGLGNLEYLKPEARGLQLRLRNACYPLIMAGTIQGMYERLQGSESHMEWELSADGTLEINLTA